MQAGFKSTTGKVTHVNFAQENRVSRVHDKEGGILAAFDFGAPVPQSSRVVSADFADAIKRGRARPFQGRLLKPWALQAGAQLAGVASAVVRDGFERELTVAEMVSNLRRGGAQNDEPCAALSAAKRRAALEALL